MSKKQKSRAELAGRQIAFGIAEMADLMYQKNTKKNFYRGLIAALKCQEQKNGNK